MVSLYTTACARLEDGERIPRGDGDVRSRPLDWVQIGAITGPTLDLPSELLRSTNLRVMGSGQGSVAPRAIVAELPSLVSALLAGRIPVEVVKVPLSQVEQTWNKPVPPGHRVVLLP